MLPKYDRWAYKPGKRQPDCSIERPKPKPKKPVAHPLRATPHQRYLTQPCCTFDEVAAEIGVSPERCRQIEVAALKKLRRGLEAQGLTFDALCPEDVSDDGWERPLAQTEVNKRTRRTRRS